MSDDRLVGGPVWQRWQDEETADLTDAEIATRREVEQAFLERQYEQGRVWAASRGPRATDRDEWSSECSHADEFGPGRD